MSLAIDRKVIIESAYEGVGAINPPVPAALREWSIPLMTGFVEFSRDPVGHATQLLLPALILGIATGAALMRLTRGMLLEVLRQDYVRTAWAKGLAERVVVMKHGLRNAIIPVVTLLGTQLPQIIGGTVIIETVFGLPV